MELTREQRTALRQRARRDPRPYVRLKALALLRVSEGHRQGVVAAFLGVGQRSVNRWVRRFRDEGLASLPVQPGRGRRARVDLVELEQYVRQSPRNFGLAQTRWTLRALAGTVPSLHGFTAAGVYYALRRAGCAYKRGQPALHSPDPEYEAKRGGWQRRFGKPGRAPAR